MSPPSVKTESPFSVWDMVHDELQKYLSVDALELDGDVLAWWKTNEVLFPNIAKFAKCILTIPATSIMSRICSSSLKSGSDERSRLTPENADRLIFIKYNKQFY